MPHVDSDTENFIEIPRIEKPVDFTQELPIAQSLRSDEVQEKLARDIREIGETAKQDRSDYASRIASYYASWRGLDETSVSTFKHCADTHVMKTWSTIQSLSARLAASLLETNPLASFTTNNPEDFDRNRLREEVFQWIMAKKVKYKRSFHMAFRNALRDGDSYLKVGWKQQQRLVKERKLVPEFDVDLETGQMFVADEKIQVVTEIETVFDWPTVDVVHALDIILPPNATGIQEEDSHFVIHRLKLPIDKLKRRQASGFYENVDKIKIPTQDQGAKSDTSGETQVIEDIKDDLSGVESNRSSLINDKFIEIWEYWGKWDLNDDGFEEEVVITLVPEQSVILRAAPNPFIHGKRPFGKFEYEPEENKPYSVALTEVIQPQEDMMNAFRNLRLDVTLLASSPILLVQEDLFSKLEAKQFNPGDTVPVEDFNDVFILKWPSPDPSIFLAEQEFDNNIQEITGITEFFQGREQVNRPTARGTVALLTQAGERLRPLIDRFEETSEEVYSMIFSNMQQFMDDTVYVQVLGPDGVKVAKRVSKTDIQGQFTLSIDATAGNRQLQAENNIQFFGLTSQLLAIPLEEQIGRTGIDVREQVRIIGQDLKIKNLDRIILSREEANQILEREVRLRELRVRELELTIQAGEEPQEPLGQPQLPARNGGQARQPGSTDIRLLAGR